jgi:hypothetical protein
LRRHRGTDHFQRPPLGIDLRQGQVYEHAVELTAAVRGLLDHPLQQGAGFIGAPGTGQRLRGAADDRLRAFAAVDGLAIVVDGEVQAAFQLRDFAFQN